MGRVSEQVREEAAAAYVEGGQSAAEVAKRYGTSVRNLQRWVACYRVELGKPSSAAPGRVYDAAEQQLLRAYAQANPQATHEQLRQYMAERTGKAVHKSTLRDLLRMLGLSGRRTATAPPQAKKKTRRRNDKKRRPARPKAVAPERTAPVTPQPTRYTRAHRRDDTDRYPTDLTDAEWRRLQPHFVSQGGRPPDHPPRLMLNAIFYLLRSGCPWRMLPHDFPPWKSVYSTFRRWRRDGRLRKAHDALRRQLRTQLGRNEEPTALIVDSQSVKTTEKGGLAATTAASR